MDVGPINLAVNYANAAAVFPTANLVVTPGGVLEVVNPTVNPTVVPIGSAAQRTEEILGSGALALTDTWALLGALRYDITNHTPIADGLGLKYQDDCMTLAVTYEQSKIQDQLIRPDQRVMVTLSLKYLGTFGYETSAFNSLVSPLAWDSSGG
jgi:lipopolysaccharide assembly outer membrane protein LptD (OstA)